VLEVALILQPPARLAPAHKSVLESNAFTQSAGKEIANTARAVLPQAIMLKSLTMGPFAEIVGGPFRQAFDAIMGGKVAVQDAMNQPTGGFTVNRRRRRPPGRPGWSVNLA
jgi:hypothetical protein